MKNPSDGIGMESYHNDIHVMTGSVDFDENRVEMNNIRGTKLHRCPLFVCGNSEVSVSGFLSCASKFVPVAKLLVQSLLVVHWKKKARIRKTTILLWVVIGEQFFVVLLWCRRSPQLTKVCGRAIVVSSCQRYSPSCFNREANWSTPSFST